MFRFSLEVADLYIKISMSLMQLATTDHTDLEKFLTRVAETFEKLRVCIYNYLLLDFCTIFRKLSL